MSSFIPMVSSSPPPMDEGGGMDWDDDDEFGTFTGAVDSNSFPQAKQSHQEVVVTTSIDHSVSNWNQSNGSSQWSSHNNNFADFAAFTNESNGHIGEDLEISDSFSGTNDLRPRTIELIKDEDNEHSLTDVNVSSNHSDKNTGQDTVHDSNGMLTDSGLYSSDVSPVQMCDETVRNYMGQVDTDSLEEFDIELTAGSGQVSNKSSEVSSSDETPTESKIVSDDIVAYGDLTDTSKQTDSDSGFTSKICDISEILPHINVAKLDYDENTSLSDSNSNETSPPIDVLNETNQTEIDKTSLNDSDCSPKCTDTIEPPQFSNTHTNIPYGNTSHSGAEHTTTIANDQAIDSGSDINDTVDTFQNTVTETGDPLQNSIEVDTDLSKSDSSSAFSSKSYLEKDNDENSLEELDNEALTQDDTTVLTEESCNSGMVFNQELKSDYTNVDARTGDVSSESSNENFQITSCDSNFDASEMQAKSEELENKEIGEECEVNFVSKDDSTEIETSKDDSIEIDVSKDNSTEIDETSQKEEVDCSGPELHLKSAEVITDTELNEKLCSSKLEIKEVESGNDIHLKEESNECTNATEENGKHENYVENKGEFESSNDDKSEKNTENDFGDIGGNDDDFRDFSDNPDDDFGNFSDNNEDFGDFSTSGFAEFNSNDSPQTNTDGPSEDWAAFSEPQTRDIVKSVDDEDEDDEWAAFGEESTDTVSQAVVEPVKEDMEKPSQSPMQSMNKHDKIIYAVTMCFPTSSQCDVEADVHITDIDRLIAEDSESSVWCHIKDLQSTNSLTFQWIKSKWNNQLYTTLHVDTRNILIGHKKAAVPIFASGLTLLEPTKGAVAATNTLKPDVLVDTSRSDSISSQSQETIPPAQFDWSSSGLTNPLEASNKTLNLDFIIQDQATKSSALESEFLATNVSPVHKPVIQPLENILANLKSTSTFKPTNQNEDLSGEAGKIVHTLPDLLFMKSKVLMFPIKMDK